MQHLDEQDQVKAEVKAMADLTHPCIVDLKEVLSDEQSVFMVMQYCPGGRCTIGCGRRGVSARRRRDDIFRG